MALQWFGLLTAPKHFAATAPILKLETAEQHLKLSTAPSDCPQYIWWGFQTCLSAGAGTCLCKFVFTENTQHCEPKQPQAKKTQSDLAEDLRVLHLASLSRQQWWQLEGSSSPLPAFSSLVLMTGSKETPGTRNSRIYRSPPVKHGREWTAVPYSMPIPHEKRSSSPKRVGIWLISGLRNPQIHTSFHAPRSSTKTTSWPKRIYWNTCFIRGINTWL